SIPCFDTSCDLSSNEEDFIPAMKELIHIAKQMQVPYVSVVALQDNEELVRDRLTELMKDAEEADVTILIKTSGIYSDTARLRSLMDEFACDQFAALWDVHHPYRDYDESADTTIKNLGAYVKHVHMRDSDDKNTYNLIGEGNLPIEDVMRALSSIDYDGFISLEWKTEWMEDLPDYEIIFPHFVNYMSRFEKTRGKKKVLYPNHNGTGQYVWKKDELINLTFSQVLDRMVEEFPDQYAFKYTTLDYVRTYEEFRDDVDQFARALISMGVKAGTKVSIWATNVPAWYITFWATTKIGAVLVSVNTAYKRHEADYLFRQSDTHTLVMVDSCLDSNYKDIINEICPEIATSKPGEPLHCKRLPFLRNVITVGFKQPGCLTFDEAMERGDLVPQEELNRMAARVRPDDVCNMQYTSGTTGFPKGVMLTHYNVVNNGKCIGDRMGLSTADRMMIQVPMFHCFGMVLSMTASLTHGATVCPMPYFSAKSSLACINQERITCFNGVPTMFIAMFNHEDYKKTDFSHMRTGIMAGAGCPPELMRRAADPNEMNMTGIVSVYGQTESSPGSTMSAWTDPLDLRCDTVGYDFPHVECKIIDPETGEEVPDGENGEFCSRGYNTMKGYYKMPEATRDTVDAEGWLHSGDLACRDKDGTYRITGRLKDMIIRGGENLYPKEIEEFIYTHSFVQDVQVIGVPDKRYGEEAMACIILKEGKSMTVQEMHDYIAASMARHKVPKYIEFVDAFPMNAAGKVLKYKMREEATKRLGLENAAGIDTAKSNQ
ncbi:MAG: AMP-dependent synthetase, partial [Lachnospiraceae bacterium]|nr:AMP-dependent synthetase [Lachnospiraceae bacterium]